MLAAVIIWQSKGKKDQCPRPRQALHVLKALATHQVKTTALRYRFSTKFFPSRFHLQTNRLQKSTLISQYTCPSNKKAETLFRKFKGAMPNTIKCSTQTRKSGRYTLHLHLPTEMNDASPVRSSNVFTGFTSFTLCTKAYTHTHTYMYMFIFIRKLQK